MPIHLKLIEDLKDGKRWQCDKFPTTCKRRKIKKIQILFSPVVPNWTLGSGIVLIKDLCGAIDTPGFGLPVWIPRLRALSSVSPCGKFVTVENVCCFEYILLKVKFLICNYRAIYHWMLWKLYLFLLFPCLIAKYFYILKTVIQKTHNDTLTCTHTYTHAHLYRVIPVFKILFFEC